MYKPRLVLSDREESIDGTSSNPRRGPGSRPPRRTARSAPDVALSMMLHTTELKLNGRFFAFARDDTIVVKLNRPGFRGGSGVWFSVPGFGWVW